MQDVVSVRVNIIKGMGSKSLRARELVASKIVFIQWAGTPSGAEATSHVDAVAASACGAASGRFGRGLLFF